MSSAMSSTKKVSKSVRFADEEVTVLEYFRFSKPEQGFDAITKKSLKRARADSVESDLTPPQATLTPPQTPEHSTKRVHFQDDDNVTLEYYGCSSPSSGFLAVTKADTPPASPTTSEIGGACRYTGHIPKAVHFGGPENVMLEYSPFSKPQDGFTTVTRFRTEHMR